MFLQTRVCLKLLHQGEHTRNFRSEQFGSCTNSDDVLIITCKEQSSGSQHRSLCACASWYSLSAHIVLYVQVAPLPCTRSCASTSISAASRCRCRSLGWHQMPTSSSTANRAACNQGCSSSWKAAPLHRQSSPTLCWLGLAW